MDYEVKVHKVIEGPFEVDDEEDGTSIWLLCLGEENGSLKEIDVYFDTFNEAYSFKNHFLTSINPIVLSQGYQDN